MKTLLTIGCLVAGAWVGAASAQNVMINVNSGPQRSSACRTAPSYSYARPAQSYRHVRVPPAPQGYWQLQCKRVKVPGHWTHGYSPCGNLTKQWVPGGYRNVSQYVWVPRNPKPACGSTVVFARR